MAPITAFVQLTKRRALPCRVFVNRKEILKSLKQDVVFEAVVSSAQTTNHKALVRLRSSSPVYLSNGQLESLMLALRPHLVNLMLISTPESLRLSSQSKPKEDLQIIVDSDGWKVKITMAMDFVMNVRLGGYDDDGVSLLVRRPRQMGTPETTESHVALLEEEEQEQVIPQEGETVDLTGDIKFVQKYNYSPIRTLAQGIKIEVLRIPKSTK